MACIRIQPKMNVPVLALLLTVAAAAQTSNRQPGFATRD